MWFEDICIVKTDSDFGIKYYIGVKQPDQDYSKAERMIARLGVEVSVPLLKTFLGLSEIQENKPISNNVMKRREAMMWWNTLTERDKREYSNCSPNGLTGSVIEAIYTKAFG